MQASFSPKKQHCSSLSFPDTPATGLSLRSRYPPSPYGTLRPFFPLLSATIRRYHDSGTPGWKAILFNALSLLFLIPGFFISSFTIIGFLFAGGYAVTASSSVNMAGLLKPGISGILFLSAGASFAILNIKTILRPSDPKENPYGKPTSFHPPHKTKPQI